MSDPFLGEIKMWAFNWAPNGWALCDGATMQVQQNQALFALLGTSFGGNGTTTFLMPDLRGRTPIGVGLLASESRTYAVGNNGGAETVGVTAATTPAHTHDVQGYPVAGTVVPPTGNNIANIVSATTPSTTNFASYLPQANWSSQVQLATDSVSVAGASAPHPNMQPFTVVNFTICTVGSFPPRN